MPKVTRDLTRGPDDALVAEAVLRSHSQTLTAPERAREILSVYRDWHERESGQMHERPRFLSKIWSPGAVRANQTQLYFDSLPYAGELPYGAALFAKQPNFSEVLFGGLAYNVDREIVFSMHNRLTEIGTQKLSAGDDGKVKVPLVLQESHAPDAPPGSQAVLYSADQLPSSLTAANLEAALVRAFKIPGRIQIKKQAKPGLGESRYEIRFVLPADLSWDGQDHTVKLDFEVQVPERKGNNGLTGLLKFFGALNGRPAQHYQHDAATVIHLKELSFAKSNSIRLVIDAGTPRQKNLTPDTVLGSKLVLILSQTAGGFFEKAFWQARDGRGIKSELVDARGTQHDLKPERQAVYDEDDHELRLTSLSLDGAPYQTQVVEKRLMLPSGASVFETKEMRFLSVGNQSELMAIQFNTGIGRGIRDLGYRCDVAQKGRFAFRVDGITGFAYGDFVVSPTRQIATDASGSPHYYTSIVLTPKFSRDMKNKRIILHVLHTKEGVYTETQVVPRKVVWPPK